MVRDSLPDDTNFTVEEIIVPDTRRHLPGAVSRANCHIPKQIGITPNTKP